MSRFRPNTAGDAPAARPRPPPRVRREIDILTPDDVRALISACSRRAPTGVRNRAVIALMYGSGLRVGESLALRSKDVDLDRLTVTVHSGKLGKRRVAGLLPEAVDPIQRWVDLRSRLGVTPQDPFFCSIARGASGPHPTAPGGKLAREYVARVLKRLGRRVGLAKRLHCHNLRHSHADLLRRRGFDMEEIRVQLGHASLEITGRYLAHLGANDLPDKMRSVGGVLADEPQMDPREKLAALLDGISRDDARRLVEILSRQPRHAARPIQPRSPR